MTSEDHNINAEAVNDRAKLIMHRLLARQIKRDPSLIEAAKARFSGCGPDAPAYVEDWLAILEQPVDDIRRDISSRSENMRWLRLSTPFRALSYMRDVAWRKRLWRKARLGVVDEAQRLKMADNPLALLPERVQWGAPALAETDTLLRSIIQDLEAAGIEGAGHLISCCRGWVWPVQVFAEHLIAYAPSTAQPIKIEDAKEKYGTLRLTVSGDRIAQSMADWCERQSEDRCAATGMPGRLRDYRWMLTLSDSMAKIYERGPEGKSEVLDMIYPRRLRSEE